MHSNEIPSGLCGREQHINRAREYFAHLTPELNEFDLCDIVQGFIHLTQIAAEEDNVGLYEEWSEKCENLLAGYAIDDEGSIAAFAPCLTEIYFNGLRLGHEASHAKLEALLNEGRWAALGTLIEICIRQESTPVAWIDKFCDHAADTAWAWFYYYNELREKGIAYNPNEAAVQFTSPLNALLNGEIDQEDSIEIAGWLLPHLTKEEDQHALACFVRETIADVEMSEETYHLLIDFALAVFDNRLLSSLHEDWLSREEEIMRNDLCDRFDTPVDIMATGQFLVARAQCGGAQPAEVQEIIDAHMLLEPILELAVLLGDQIVCDAAKRYAHYNQPEDAGCMIRLIQDDMLWQDAVQDFGATFELALAVPDELDVPRQELFTILSLIIRKNDYEQLSERLFFLSERALGDRAAFEVFLKGIEVLNAVYANHAADLLQEFYLQANQSNSLWCLDRLHDFISKFRTGQLKSYQHFVEANVSDIDRPQAFARFAQLALLARGQNV